MTGQTRQDTTGQGRIGQDNMSHRSLSSNVKHGNTTTHVCHHSMPPTLRNLNDHPAPFGRTHSLLQILVACVCTLAAARLQH